MGESTQPRDATPDSDAPPRRTPNVILCEIAVLLRDLADLLEERPS